MHLYKVLPNNAIFHVIERNQYEKDTQSKFPFVQQNDKGEACYFAICPACDNPIQIINLYHSSDKLLKPYGKHYHKPVSGANNNIVQLGYFNPDNYKQCPFAAHNANKRYKSSDRKSKLDETSRKILTILGQHLDRIIYLIQKDIGFHIGKNLLTNMLQNYINFEGYLYCGATILNIPWIFAYMAKNHSLFGKKIIDSTLKDTILEKTNKFIKMEEGYFIFSSKIFTELNFYFTNHIPLSANNKKESIDLVITYRVSNSEFREPQEIYRKTIEMNHVHFSNLLNLDKWHKNSFSDYCIEQANELISPILIR